MKKFLVFAVFTMIVLMAFFGCKNDLVQVEDKTGTITWLGSFDKAPENPALYAAYFNTTDGCSYIWTGNGWSLFAQPGAAGMPTGTAEAEMAKQMTCTATEEGILFTGMVLNNDIADNGTALKSMYEIDIYDEDNWTHMMATNTKASDNWDSWEYTYPLVESGKEYNFTVTVAWCGTVLCAKKFTVTAVGGLGEYKVENKNVISLSDDKILTRTEQVFSNNPNVSVLQYCTFYILTSVSEDARNIWAGGHVWLAEGYAYKDTVNQVFDLTKTIEYTGWRDFSYLEAHLAGRALGVSAETRAWIAGYTYNDTVYFKLGDYTEAVFDWDDLERGLFVVYPDSDAPGTEKKYLIETDFGYSFVPEGTQGAKEVWGKFQDMNAGINAPAYIPDAKAVYAEKADYYKFTGNWTLSLSNAREDGWLPSISLPYQSAAQFAGEATAENLIDGVYVLAKAIPEFKQIKADFAFYEENPEMTWNEKTGEYEYVYGETIHSATANIPDSGIWGDFINSIYPVPEKENYDGAWNWFVERDDAGLKSYKCVLVYELAKITVNFLDESGNVLLDSVVRNKSDYWHPDYYDPNYDPAEWRRIWIPSIPYKEGKIGMYWEDENGRWYSSMGAEYTFGDTEPVVNFHPVYRDASVYTVNYYDNDGTTLIHTTTTTESPYNVSYESLLHPSGKLGFTFVHWMDQYGKTYDAGDLYQLYDETTNFTAVYVAN